MSQKTVWLTWMASGDNAPSSQPAITALSQSGFAANGAPWVDNAKELAWSELSDVLKSDATGPDVWIIGARREDLCNPDHRFGWSMAAAMIAKPSQPDVFRLRVTAHKHLGLWLEVGPTKGEWSGGMVGVTGDAKITNHAAGLKGGLPERTVLEFKLEGLESEVGNDSFVAWAVKNKTGIEDSYYVKVEGTPGKLLIGEHPDDAADVSVVSF